VGVGGQGGQVRTGVLGPGTGQDGVQPPGGDDLHLPGGQASEVDPGAVDTHQRAHRHPEQLGDSGGSMRSDLRRRFTPLEKVGVVSDLVWQRVRA
jgi:hypothetical protein